jgi:hypothetical protein
MNARSVLIASNLLLVACSGGSGGSEPLPPEEPGPTVTEEPGPAGEPAPDAAPTAAPVAAPEPEAAPIPVGALKMKINNKGKIEVVELGADGTVKTKKDGKVVLKFVKNEVVDEEGKWVFRVKHHGTIESRHVERVVEGGVTKSEKEKVQTFGKFVDGDAAQGEKGTMVVENNGAVIMQKTDGKKEPVKEITFEGVNATTRRAATLLVLSFFAASTVVTETSSSTAPPKTPPAPPGKAPPPAAPKTPAPAPAPAQPKK